MALPRTLLAMLALTGVLVLLFCALVLPPQPDEIADIASGDTSGNYSYADSTPGNYTPAELDYFAEICGATYELGGDVPLVKKWDGDLRINVTGVPTVNDRYVISRAVRALDQLTGDVRISLNEDDPNVVIYVGPPSRFGNYLPFVSDEGGFNVWNRNDSMAIDRAAVAISSGEDEARRAFQLSYALMAILGCPGRSSRYPDSIFYTPSRQQAGFSDLDRAVIRMLYDGRVRPGMTAEQARTALTT